MVERPVAVKVYCGVIVALLVVALLLVAAPALLSLRPGIGDLLLMFVPMAVLLFFLWGVWLVRWWGVVGLSIAIVLAEGWMIAAMPERQGVVAVIRGALWLIPLWVIAWTYRRRFR